MGFFGDDFLDTDFLLVLSTLLLLDTLRGLWACFLAGLFSGVFFGLLAGDFFPVLLDGDFDGVSCTTSNFWGRLFLLGVLAGLSFATKHKEATKLN